MFRTATGFSDNITVGSRQICSQFRLAPVIPIRADDLHGHHLWGIIGCHLGNMVQGAFLHHFLTVNYDGRIREHDYVFGCMPYACCVTEQRPPYAIVVVVDMDDAASLEGVEVPSVRQVDQGFQPFNVCIRERTNRNNILINPINVGDHLRYHVQQHLLSGVLRPYMYAGALWQALSRYNLPGVVENALQCAVEVFARVPISREIIRSDVTDTSFNQELHTFNFLIKDELPITSCGEDVYYDKIQFAQLLDYVDPDFIRALQEQKMVTMTPNCLFPSCIITTTNQFKHNLTGSPTIWLNNADNICLLGLALDYFEGAHRLQSYIGTEACGIHEMMYQMAHLVHAGWVIGMVNNGIPSDLQLQNDLTRTDLRDNILKTLYNSVTNGHIIPDFERIISLRNQCDLSMLYSSNDPLVMKRFGLCHWNVSYYWLCYIAENYFNISFDKSIVKSTYEYLPSIEGVQTYAAKRPITSIQLNNIINSLNYMRTQHQVWFNTRSRDEAQKSYAIPVFDVNWVSQKMFRMGENSLTSPSEINFKLTTNCMMVSEIFRIGKMMTLLPVTYTNKLVGNISISQDEDTSVRFMEWYTGELVNTSHIYKDVRTPVSMQRIVDTNQFRKLDKNVKAFRSNRHVFKVDSFRN